MGKIPLTVSLLRRLLPVHPSYTVTFGPPKRHSNLIARKMAMSIAQNRTASAIKREKSARLYMERYGSHFPAGVQTLGGAFFSIADAESKSTTDTQKLT